MGFGGWGKRVSQGPLRLLQQSCLPVAIDFGVSSLKLLQIASGPPVTLLGAGCVDTPDELLTDTQGRLAFQLAALPRLVRSCGFKVRRAICAIPAAQTFCKHMQFLPGDSASIGAQVRPAVAGQLGCDPNALVYRHVDVGAAGRDGGGSKTEVICFATTRELVSRLMDGTRNAKLELVGMHAEYVAMVRAFDGAPAGEDGKNATLYLDMGTGTTKVSVAHGKDLVFARGVELGGRHFDQAIAAQSRCPLGEARRARTAMAGAAPASGSGAAATAVAEPVADRGDVSFVPRGVDLSEPLEILTDEISLCLRYYESLFPCRRVGRAVFAGGEARHVGLCQHVARKLKMPAQSADPMAGVVRTGGEPTIGVDFRVPQPGWAMLLGLSRCPTDL